MNSQNIQNYWKIEIPSLRTVSRRFAGNVTLPAPRKYSGTDGKQLGFLMFPAVAPWRDASRLFENLVGTRESYDSPKTLGNHWGSLCFYVPDKRSTGRIQSSAGLLGARNEQQNRMINWKTLENQWNSLCFCLPSLKTFTHLKNASTGLCRPQEIRIC